MKKILFLICIISLFSCSKVDNEISDTKPQLNLSLKKSLNLDGEDGPIENPLYAAAFDVSRLTLLQEYANGVDQLSIDSNNISAKKDIYVSLFTLAAVSLHANPSIEFMTTYTAKESAVSDIIFPPGQPIPAAVSPKAACILQAIISFLSSQTSLIKAAMQIVNIAVGPGQMTKAALTEIVKNALRGMVNNLEVEVGIAITVFQLTLCLAFVDEDSLTPLIVENFESQNLAATELAAMVKVFMATEPTIDRMKFSLLSKMRNIIEHEEYDPASNSMMTVRTYNPEYYSIKNSNDHFFLFSKISNNLAFIKDYLNTGNITDFGLDEESL